MKPIPVAGPWITQREIDYVTDAVTRCWYGSSGEYNERFECAFAEYVGVRHAVSLPSCTSAIHLALAAMNVGAGDEVIVPDVTWIASAAPISYVGADAVFADIDETNWCLCPRSFESCITEKTKAVVVVDLYGNMPNVEEIRAIADRCGIAVIEDAAEAFGSEFGGRKAGSFGDCGVFSFHGSKTMTTGEGGMLVTDREDLYKRVLFLRDHGRQPGDVSFCNREVAYKYKMTSMQAALGLAQVERADELVDRKREIFQWYADELHDVPHIALNPEPTGVKNSYWMSTVVLDSRLEIGKEDLGMWMAERGIDTRPLFHPLSSIPAYCDQPLAKAAAQRNEASYRISPYGINLPCALTMTREQAVCVASVLRGGIARLCRNTANAA